MTDFLEPLKNGLEQFGWRDIVDIIIVAIIIYLVIRVLAKTRALRMLIGLGVILLFARVFELLNLVTVTWLFTWILNASAVLIVVLFQPEIRRALEKLGQAKVFGGAPSVRDGEKLVEQFSRAIINMAKHKVGAIIVFERKTGLAEVLESGTLLDAAVSDELVENIFYPNTPLHDGAMVVRDGRIIAAGCFLPLSDNKHLSSELGTRHRAALGVSEISDSYVIVVSEERGTISFAHDGALERYLDAKTLKSILTELFLPTEGNTAKRGAGKAGLLAEAKEANAPETVKEAEEKDREDGGQ
ncbi:MAG TPA: TIGR00159 family protein [Clostridiales bacterium]|nr:TIGR00159 family protein [Clostridiales bacterium]